MIGLDLFVKTLVPKTEIQIMCFYWKNILNPVNGNVRKNLIKIHIIYI